jgi:hypothetical protein
MRRIVPGSCLAVLLIQGCSLTPTSGDSTPVPVRDALLTLEDQLQATTPVTLGTVGTDDGKNLFKDAVRAAQCKDKTANPLMPVITGPISLQLQGSVTKAGAGALTGSLTPSGTYTYTVTKGQQQQFTVAYSFVPVSGLANFFLAQNVASLANLPDGDPKKKVVTSLTDAWKYINDAVAEITKDSKDVDWGSATICKSEKIKGPKNTIVPYFKRIPLQLN